jgi:hypothetical protein
MFSAREEWFGDMPSPLNLGDLVADETSSPASLDQRFLACGGLVFVFRRAPDGARFSAGKILVTAGALRALAESGGQIAALLLRHVRGDWGRFGQFDQVALSDDELHRGWLVTDETDKINKSNLLKNRDWILSEYRTACGKHVRIITDLNRGTAMTVVLLSES